MANHIISWQFRLTDAMSKSLRAIAKLAADANRQAQQMNATAKQLPATISQLHSRLMALQNNKAIAQTESEIRRLNGEIKRTQRELQRLENLPPKGFLNRLREIPKAMMGVSFKDLASMYGVRMASRFFKESAKLYDVEIKSQAQLRAALKSTDYTAGRTFEQLTERASELQKKTLFGNEVTQQAQAVLLTFTNVRGKIFDKAIPAAMDMATRKGMDLQSAIMSIGRALNSPADGLALLSRNGVQFSDEMELQIKKLAESGRLEEAQLLILDELFKKVGGSAEAAAQSGLGRWQQLSNMWGDLRERLGGFVLNIANNILPALRNLLEWLDRNGAAIKALIKIVATGAIGWVSYKLAVAACTVSIRALAAGSLFMRMVSILLHYGMQGLIRAFVVFNSVTKANVIGALISVALMAVSIFTMFRKSADSSTEAMKRAKSAAEGYYAQEKSNLDIIFAKLKQTNPKSKERNQLVDELKRMYPDLNAQLEQELRNTNNLSGAYDVLIAKIRQRALVKAKETALEDIYKETAEIETAVFDYIDRNTDKRGKGVFYEQEFNGTEFKGYVGRYTDKQDFEKGIMSALFRTGQYSDGHGGKVTVGFENMRKYEKAKEREESLLKQIAGITLGDGKGASAETTTTPLAPTADPAATISGLTSGGARETNVHINFRNLIENLKMYPQTLREGIDETTDALTEGLLRVVNSANRAAQ